MGTSIPKRAARPLVMLCTALGVAGGAGCQDDRTTIFQPFGPPVFNFGMTAVGASGSLPGGSVDVALVDVATSDTAVVVTLENLVPLSSGVYQIWVVADSAGTMFVSPNARIVMDTSFVDDATGVVVSSSVVLAPSGRSFNPPTATYDRIRVEIRQTLNGAVNQAANYHVVLTLEEATAAAPGASRFLWRRFGGSDGTGPLIFGSFGGGEPANDVTFAVAGTGLGGVRGDEISVDFQQLVRPPIGFAYEGWLMRAGGNVRVGDLTTPPPERLSLRNADVETGQPQTSPTAILNANIRAFAQEDLGLGVTNPYAAFEEFRLVLVPKQAVGPGATFILVGVVPEDVTAGDS